MKMTTVLVASAAVVTVLMLVRSPIEKAHAEATRPAGDATQLLYRLDRDADGKLSFLEAKQDKHLATEFYHMDLNLDGFLSPDELSHPQI